MVIPSVEEFVEAYLGMKMGTEKDARELYDLLTNPARTEEFVAGLEKRLLELHEDARRQREV